MPKMHTNRRKEITKNNGKRRETQPRQVIATTKAISPEDIAALVFRDLEEQQLLVGVRLGKSEYGLCPTDADGFSQSLIQWLATHDEEHAEVSLCGGKHILNAQGLYNLALLVSEYATIVDLLTNQIDYLVETSGLDRVQALDDVMTFLASASNRYGAEATYLA